MSAYRSFTIVLSFVIILSAGKLVYSMDAEDEYNIKEDTLHLTNDNMKEVLNKNRDYTLVILFSSTNPQYQCLPCRQIELELIQLQQAYYSSKESSNRKLVFSIVDIDNGRDVYLKYKVTYLPYFMIVASPGDKSIKPVNAYKSDHYMTSLEMYKYMNEILSLHIKPQIEAEKKPYTYLLITIFSLLFSLLFVPGSGFIELLQWRGSYLRLTLIVIFLCLGCIPYVLINNPQVLKETTSKTGKPLYKFFSNGDQKYALEGVLVSVWYIVTYLACYGMYKWTSEVKSQWISAFLTAILLALLMIAMEELYNYMKYAFPFLGAIVDHAKVSMLGQHSCFFCKSYWDYLVVSYGKKKTNWSRYIQSLGKWWRESFK